MTTQNDFGWAQEHKKLFQTVFTQMYPEEAKLIAGRFDLLPTPKEIVTAFQAMARQVLQKAKTRDAEAELIIENPAAGNNTADADRLYSEARREARSNQYVAEELSGRADIMDTETPSNFGRAEYREAAINLVKFIAHGEKADLTDLSRYPSPELTAEDLYRNLPQDARERLDRLRPQVAPAP